MLLPPSGAVLLFTYFFGGMTGAAMGCESILSAWSTSHNQYFSSPCHGHGHKEVWQLWVLFCLGFGFNTTCHVEKCQFLTSWTLGRTIFSFKCPIVLEFVMFRRNDRRGGGGDGAGFLFFSNSPPIHISEQLGNLCIKQIHWNFVLKIWRENFLSNNSTFSVYHGLK